MDNATNEIWKDITGFEKYQVSNLGRIASKNYRNSGEWHILKQFISPSGYVYVNLSTGDGYMTQFVHRLVMKTFNPTSDKTLQVDHINNKRHDNRLKNLRWVSRKQNNSRLHARRLKSLKSKRTSHADMFVKAVKDDVTIYFKTQEEAAKHIGCCRVLVTKVLNESEPNINMAMGWRLEYVPTSACPELSKSIQLLKQHKIDTEKNIREKFRLSKKLLAIQLRKEIKMEQNKLKEELKHKTDEYIKSKNTTNELFKEIEQLKKQILSLSYNNQKWKLHSVNQYDMKGNLIKEWRTVSDIKKILGLDVTSCVKGFKESVGGFVWKYTLDRNAVGEVEE